MLAHLEPARPVSIGAATALAILKDATGRLDLIRADAESELARHVRTRSDLEALIERLIAGLDDLDQGDEDREPALAGSHPLDCDREGVNEDGDPLDVGEMDESVGEDGGTAPETYGRGWSDAEAFTAATEGLFTNIRPALFLSWKAGRCTSAAFIPSEGRARA